jgi:hypothetical protein
MQELDHVIHITMICVAVICVTFRFTFVMHITLR